MKPAILVFSGSARTNSLNKVLAAVAATHARHAGADVTIADLRNFPMPIYDGDIEAEAGLPVGAIAFRALLAAHQGFIVTSPEHNGSVSALLKNVLDWSSRPANGLDGIELFRGKTVGLMSASLSPYGGVRSVAHLRGIFSKMGANVLADEVLVATVQNAFDADGRLTNPASDKLTAQLAANVATQIRRAQGS